jgi:hypothetical protein
VKYSHKGNAKVTTLASGLSPTDLTITGADLTGWPNGSDGPFWASINKGTLSEEKVLCSGRSGDVLQVFTDAGGNGRGMDDTVAQTHNVNATLEHVWTATEAEAASAHIAETNGAHGYPAAANLVTLDGAQTVTGVKTLESPVLETPTVTAPSVTGGTHTAATKMSLTGVQAEAEFRVRNTYIGVGPPSDSLGSDGDLYIDKG